MNKWPKHTALPERQRRNVPITYKSTYKKTGGRSGKVHNDICRTGGGKRKLKSLFIRMKWLYAELDKCA
jgi:hypothetical protein